MLPAMPLSRSSGHRTERPRACSHPPSAHGIRRGTRQPPGSDRSLPCSDSRELCHWFREDQNPTQEEATPSYRPDGAGEDGKVSTRQQQSCRSPATQQPPAKGWRASGERAAADEAVSQGPRPPKGHGSLPAPCFSTSRSASGTRGPRPAAAALSSCPAQGDL